MTWLTRPMAPVATGATEVVVFAALARGALGAAGALAAVAALAILGSSFCYSASAPLDFSAVPALSGVDQVEATLYPRQPFVKAVHPGIECAQLQLNFDKMALCR